MSTAELACTYASLLLHDDGQEVTAEKLQQVLKAAGVSVEPYWPGLFAKTLANKKIDDLITNIGSGARLTQAQTLPASRRAAVPRPGRARCRARAAPLPTHAASPLLPHLRGCRPCRGAGGPACVWGFRVTEITRAALPLFAPLACSAAAWPGADACSPVASLRRCRWRARGGCARGRGCCARGWRQEEGGAQGGGGGGDGHVPLRLSHTTAARAKRGARRVIAPSAACGLLHLTRTSPAAAAAPLARLPRSPACLRSRGSTHRHKGISSSRDKHVPSHASVY